MSERTLTVVTANMLLDKTRTKNGLVPPQSERVGALAARLAVLGKTLDVVATQETHVTKHTHNGKELAWLLGYDEGFWLEHNLPVRPGAKRGRRGEYLGMFGAQVTEAQPVDLGDSRFALLTRIGQAAVMDLHLRFQPFGIKRLLQVDRALHAVRHEPYAVLVGDFNFNGLPFDPVRLRLRAAGFHSAFELTGQPEPITWPTETYRDVMLGSDGYKRKVVGDGITTDGIFVRGLEVVDARVIRGEGDEPSDHTPLTADLVAA